MTSAPSVAFVGPVAREGQSAIGGYEAANRRTITLLSRAGVRCSNFPILARAPKWLKTLIYLIGFARIAVGIVTRSKAFQLVHITPLRRQFIPAELVLCRLAKLLQQEAASGYSRRGLLSMHITATARHIGKCLKAMVAAADGIGCEGLSGVQFLADNLVARNVFYLPNYVATRGDRTPIEFEQLSQCICLVNAGASCSREGRRTRHRMREDPERDATYMRGWRL